jgi:hypothetical protein
MAFMLLTLLIAEVTGGNATVAAAVASTADTNTAKSLNKAGEDA